MQQLGGVDASFLYMETPETPMHVGGLYLYELPPDYTGDFYENFKAQIASRMHLFPILTRKLVQLPFDIDTPLWVKDDDVDLDYHIRRHTVPKPGRFDQLEELAGRLHSNFLDRSRPLWEIYIIDGLADGRIAEYTKFHHAGFDGAAAMAFIQSLYDTTPVARQVPPPSEKTEKEDLDPIKLLSAAYANGVRTYLRTIQAMPELLRAWTKFALPDPDTFKVEPLELPRPAPRTRLNAAITSQRSYAARSLSLIDIKRIAKSNGATVNDVVLAVCSGALRRYLKEKGELPSQSLTAFVPVSLREAGNIEMNNQVFGMICSLATRDAHPLKRLLAIHESASKAKRLTETIKSAALGVTTPWGMPFLVNGLMNVLGRYHLADSVRPFANLTISNNIGPPTPLYMAGAKLLAGYPISIPTHGSALNITVQSYVDNMDFGLIACRRTLPDIDTLGDYIVDALAELKSAATARLIARQSANTADAPLASTGPRSRARAPRAGRAASKSRETRPRAPAPKFPYIVTTGGAGETASAAPADATRGATAANSLSSRTAASTSTSSDGRSTAPKAATQP